MAVLAPTTALAAGVPDASTNDRVEPGRSGFLGGGTLDRPPLTERWRVGLGEQMSSPVVVGGRVYAAFREAGASGWTITGLDAADGRRLWSRTVPAEAKLAFDAGRVVALVNGGTVIALDAATGVTRWTRKLRTPYDFSTHPVAVDGLVYAGLAWSGGELTALRIEDGTIAWEAPFYFAGAPMVTGGLAFQSTGCNTLAVETGSGEQGWSGDVFDCSSYEGEAASAGGAVVVGATHFGRTGRVLDGANGELLDSFPATRSPALAGDTLVHLDGDTLRARSMSTGLELWSVGAGPESFSSAPLVVNHAVYVGTTGGELLAYDLTSGAPLWLGALAATRQPVGAPGLAAGGGLLLAPSGGDLVALESAAPSPGAGTAITAGPEGPTRETSARFTFTAAGGASECRLDAGAWVVCDDEAQYAGIPDGPHTFSVRTIGGTPAVPQALAHRGFSVDTQGPVTTVTYGPGKLTRYSGPHSFDFETGGQGVSSECRMDGGTWQPCESGVDYDGLGEGEHVFAVRSRDRLGNLGEPGEYRFTVDRTPPRIVVEEAPPSTTRDRDATVRFSLSEPATLTCISSSLPARPCSSPVTYEDLPDGSYQLDIHARDAAGNVGTRIVSWTVDTSAPEPQPAPEEPQPAPEEPQPEQPQPSQPSTQPPTSTQQQPPGQQQSPPQGIGAPTSASAARNPAKLQVERARVRGGRLDVLARITRRAGARVAVAYRAQGQTTEFTVPIVDGTARIDRRLSGRQARDTTGIITIFYGGDADVRSDGVRLRVASGRARLVREVATLGRDGRLRVGGTITDRARGVVRVRLDYATAAGDVQSRFLRARIRDGRWMVDERLTGDAARGGQLSIQFTGYLPARIPGEQDAKRVSPG